jgi:uncharacterized protein YicC (UPF0701 family)
MTGYGRAAAAASGHSVVAEIRTVNHRFLELKLRGAGLSGALEDQVSARVRASVERGSVLVNVMVQSAEAGGVRLDRGRAHQVYRELAALAAELGLPPPGLAELLATPGLLDAGGAATGSGDGAGGDGAADAELAALVDRAIEQALGAVVAMRRTEGAALAQDLTARLSRLETLTAELREQAAQAAPLLAERLLERVRKVLALLPGAAGQPSAPSPSASALSASAPSASAPSASAPSASASSPAAPGTASPPTGASAAAEAAGLDAARLAQEVALLVDRGDITEELVRLASHLEQARGLLATAGALGRRLEFLLQEIGRELNTIGAKSWSSAISARIVEAKSELEKLREQAQNVE